MSKHSDLKLFLVLCLTDISLLFKSLAYKYSVNFNRTTKMELYSFQVNSVSEASCHDGHNNSGVAERIHSSVQKSDLFR